MAVIRLQNVSFRFGSTDVLSKVSFSIAKGDFVGLVGPNGSGKTTLLRLVLGLLPLQQGRIYLLGKPIDSFSEWRRIGYIPQKAAAVPESFPATVEEVVATGLLAGKGFPRAYSAADRSQVISALSQVQMQNYAKTRIGSLSGGQQQRVLIARALIAQPDVLILDEPTAGVDQAAQAAFYDLLGALNSKGISILLVTHDLGRITSYVTKVASLNRTLEFYGSHEEFCRHPSGELDHHCLELRRG